MVRIEEIIESETKNKDKYYKIKADDKTYSIFDKSEAFGQINDGKIKLGDEVKINFQTKKVGEKTYKNVVNFEKATESSSLKEETKAFKKFATDDRDVLIIRQVAMKVAAEVLKGMSVENPLNIKDFFNLAERIEKWIMRWKNDWI